MKIIPTEIDHLLPLEPQVEEWLEQVGFTPEQWATTPMLINLPSMATTANVLIAMLHGRIGTFPAILKLRSKERGSPEFIVAEIIQLQLVRLNARAKRFASRGGN